MDMGTHLVMHFAVHAAFMGLMAVPGMAAAGIALTPGNIFLGATDMTLSVVEGATMLGDVGMSAEGADYAFGALDHGAGHDVTYSDGAFGLSSEFGVHAHGGGDAVAGLEPDPHAGHCSMESHGDAFEQWVKQQEGGFLSGLFGAEQPGLAEQWGTFSETFCPQAG